MKKFKISEKLKSWFWLCLAICFMICIFAPLEAFLANQTEFWFDFAQIAPAVMAVFGAIFFIVFPICLILQKSQKSVYIYSFLLCMLLFFYIQGNYIPRNYGVLDGAEIDWDSYNSYAIASMVLLVIGVSAWIVLCFKVKEKIYSAGRFICTILILLQLVTIGTLYIQNNILDEESSNNVVVTTKDMFKLSGESNIIVFVLDSFDSFVMEDMLEHEDGHLYKELFEGFTYYPDTVGAYPTTKGALPQILTGMWYENDKPYTDYIIDAYDNNEVYNVLNKNDYSVGVYTEPLYLSSKSNLYTNVDNGKYVVSEYDLFLQKIYRLVAFNYMPHQLKQFFYTASSDFDSLKEVETSGHVSFSLDMQKFYEQLVKEKISLTEVGNSFRFYHVEGIHAPYTFDENLKSDSNNAYDVYDEARGNLTLLRYFFEELKENGIYDSTKIIIMADHGFSGLNQNPLFMIKNAGENHEFVVSDEKMSYDYLNDIFIALANNKHITQEVISDLYENNMQRRYMYYSWDDSWDRKYLPIMTEYKAIGNADDISNFVVMGEGYFPKDNTKEIAYNLNEELSFGKEATANTYCLYGFSHNEDGHTWTDGMGAAMMFDIQDDYDDLEIVLEYTIYSESQRVIVYVNDNEVANYVATGPEEKVITIPKEYVPDNRLKLRLELPDAVSPKSKGESADGRILALAMKSLKILSR